MHPLRIGRLQNLAWQVCHCRRQREGIDDRSDAYAYANANSHPDANTDSDSDPYSNTDAHSYATAGRSGGGRIGRGFDLGLLGR